jgi:hypothetical protein
MVVCYVVLQAASGRPVNSTIGFSFSAAAVATVRPGSRIWVSFDSFQFYQQAYNIEVLSFHSMVTGFLFDYQGVS